MAETATTTTDTDPNATAVTDTKNVDGNKEVVETIVEKEVYPKDVNALLDKTRKQERDKVSTKLEKADLTEEKNTTLNDTVTSQKTRIQELEENLLKAEANTQDETETKGLTESTVSKLVATAVDKATKDLGSKVSSLEAENTKLTMNNYKSKAMIEAGDNIVAELVSGNSEAEIDSSIITAKAAYARIINGKALVEPQKDPVSPPPVGGDESTVQSTVTDETYMTDVANMTDAEYAEHRGKLLGDVSGSFAPK